MKLKQYKGRCHCGKVSFSFQSAEIKRGVRCNCSICVRRGVLFSDYYIPTEQIQLTNNPNELANYLWNDRVLNYYFCKTCGVTPYAGAQDYGYRVNLGCINELDSLSLEVGIIDGKSMPVAENPGPYPRHN